MTGVPLMPTAAAAAQHEASSGEGNWYLTDGTGVSRQRFNAIAQQHKHTTHTPHPT